MKFEAAIGKVKAIVVRWLFRYCKKSCIVTLLNKLLTSWVNLLKLRNENLRVDDVGVRYCT